MSAFNNGVSHYFVIEQISIWGREVRLQTYELQSYQRDIMENHSFNDVTEYPKKTKHKKCYFRGVKLCTIGSWAEH